MSSDSGNEKVNWSSLMRKEDWLVVWMGFLILILATSGVITKVPSIRSWSYNIFDALKLGDLIQLTLLGVGGMAVFRGRSRGRV